MEQVSTEDRPTDPPSITSAQSLIQARDVVSVVALPGGFGLIPIAMSVAQVASWTGLGKTKVQELCNAGSIDTAKVDGRTLVLTNSVVAMIERNRIVRDR